MAITHHPSFLIVRGSRMSMPEWLQDTVGSSNPQELATVARRIGLSVAAGFVVLGVYGVAHGRRRYDNPTLPTTLVLLTVVIAMVTLVIGDSIARAFGLVGALSIVRFRTVVDDTRDTAFVIFAVAVGMALGAGYGLLAFVGVPAILTAAVIM